MRSWIAILLLITLGGCSRGPDTAAITNDVTERLAQAIPPGTVTLTGLERRGSQSDPKTPAGETRRTVYFDVTLKLERDFDFGAWDAPGVAGLVSALGAGPKGITGLTSGGNKAGDILLAHGTALYTHGDSGWTKVVAGGYSPEVAPAYATNAPPDNIGTLLEGVRMAATSIPKDASPAHRAAIEEELATAAAAIRSRLARAADGYAIAAGAENGQYLRFAQALSGRKGVRMVPLITHGGEENLRLLRDGKVTLALAQGDSALDAYQGTGSFAAEGPYTALRAVGSLYPEPVHVMVRAESPFASISDLKGRRVAVGEHGSAARTTALHVLRAHGIEPTDVKTVELSMGNALVALQRKEVDAVIYVIGMPADIIRSALTVFPLRFLPLSQRAITALVADKSAYFEYSIPRGAYASHKQDVRTVATTALLLAGGSLSDSEVGFLTRFVFEKSADLVALGSVQGAQVSAATARQGLPIPLHPAAGKALDGIGATTEKQTKP